MKTTLLKTEKSIDFVKQTFETILKNQLELTRVSAPIAVLAGTGINDDLNGIERTVGFPIKSLQEQKAVVVNSLAKWKRTRLQKLGFEEGKGLITDMRAIRPDEDYSPIHSIYVDQWDWEKRITSKNKTIAFLKAEVLKIYEALKLTERKVAEEFSEIDPILPEEIKFIHSEELLRQYPSLSPQERELKITEKYGAVFLIGIGGKLSNGLPHDGRSPDYDDWSSKNEEGYTGFNGDILVWHPVLKSSFEISSMGIRVDKPTLLNQLSLSGQLERKKLFFHQLLLGEKIPDSIGGGIGQSRVCMFMLRKKHIGEVQVGIWPTIVEKKSSEDGILLL